MGPEGRRCGEPPYEHTHRWQRGFQGVKGLKTLKASNPQHTRHTHTKAAGRVTVVGQCESGWAWPQQGAAEAQVRMARQHDSWAGTHRLTHEHGQPRQGLGGGGHCRSWQQLAWGCRPCQWRAQGGGVACRGGRAVVCSGLQWGVASSDKCCLQGRPQGRRATACQQGAAGGSGRQWGATGGSRGQRRQRGPAGGTCGAAEAVHTGALGGGPTVLQVAPQLI